MTRYQKILLIIFCIAILWSAVQPYAYGDWFLEILPVFIGIPATFFIGKKFKFSNLSYTLVALLFVLPIVQAHYSVAKVPFGFTLGEWFNTSRNMFDRLTHFAFGFLMFYPLYEIFKIVTRRKFLQYFYQ